MTTAQSPAVLGRGDARQSIGPFDAPVRTVRQKQCRALRNQAAVVPADASAERSQHPAGPHAAPELTDADKREFTDLINALAEPLSQLTGTVLD